MTIATFMAALALALALWRWDRARDPRNLAEVRRQPGRGRVIADRHEYRVERKPVAATAFEWLSTWCAGPRRPLLLAPLPLGVGLLAVNRGLAGAVFLVGVPLAAVYLLVVTRGTTPKDEA